LGGTRSARTEPLQLVALLPASPASVGLVGVSIGGVRGDSPRVAGAGAQQSTQHE